MQEVHPLPFSLFSLDVYKKYNAGYSFVWCSVVWYGMVW